MSQKQHSRLGASVASRWMNCPGSPRMVDLFPDGSGTSEYAREGTAAHMLAEQWLRHGEEFVANANVALIPGTDEQVEVDGEMREAVRVYVDEVRRQHEEIGGELLIEQRFDLGEHLSVPEPMFGTADAVIVSKAGLRVVDLKYGQGVVVEAKGNPQLLYYALGALFASGLYRTASRGDEVTVTIVQPRAPHPDGPIRSMTVTVADLMTFADSLLKAAQRTQEPDAPLVPGTWCRFCPAIAHCPAQRTHAQLVAQTEFEAMPLDRPPAPETLPLDVAADILSKAHILEDWLNALRARVARELEAGAQVDGFKLVDKRAVRKWTSEQDYLMWAEGNGLDPYAAPVVHSPAQMEKLVGKKNVPQELIVSISSGVTLVPSSDPRPAAALAAQRDFLALPAGGEEE